LSAGARVEEDLDSALDELLSNTLGEETRNNNRKTTVSKASGAAASSFYDEEDDEEDDDFQNDDDLSSAHHMKDSHPLPAKLIKQVSEKQKPKQRKRGIVGKSLTPRRLLAD
jgi:hypothetical protein